LLGFIGFVELLELLGFIDRVTKMITKEREDENTKGEQHLKHRCLFYAVGITIAFGILQEFVQSFVSGRFVSLADIGLNTIGIALAVLYIHIHI